MYTTNLILILLLQEKKNLKHINKTYKKTYTKYLKERKVKREKQINAICYTNTHMYC